MRCTRIIGFIVVAGLLSSPLTGCSSKRATTVETTEVRHDGDRAYSGDETVQVTKTEKTTESDNHHGFFGILGDIIALPFRAIGSIL